MVPGPLFGDPCYSPWPTQHGIMTSCLLLIIVSEPIRNNVNDPPWLESSLFCIWVSWSAVSGNEVGKRQLFLLRSDCGNREL